MTKPKLRATKDRITYEDSPNEPDMRSILIPAMSDSKIMVPRDLITSDKNNRTKTRNPAPFNMAVINDLGDWDTYRTESSASKKFEDNIDQHWISHDGWSRAEYVDTSKAYLMGEHALQLDSDKKLTEGSRK